MRDVDVRETEISTQRSEQQSRAARASERTEREIRAAIHMCASLFKVAVRKFGGGSLGQKERRKEERGDGIEKKHHFGSNS